MCYISFLLMLVLGFSAVTVVYQEHLWHNSVFRSSE